MELQIVKHSYQEAFGSILENVAVCVDGVYTRVWFHDNKTTVKMNVRTSAGRPGSRKITGKKAHIISDFAKTYIELAK